MERIAPANGGDPDVMAMHAFALELTDATSLLWRMEMTGLEVPRDLSSDVATASAPLCDEALFPFVTVHQVYALARAQRDAEVHRLFAAARNAAKSQPPDRQAVWRDVGFPVMTGAVAWARDEMAAAVEALHGVAHQIP